MYPNLLFVDTVDKEIKKTVLTIFGTYEISIGALLRKIPYLLMHLSVLCGTTSMRGEWHTSEYDFIVFNQAKKEELFRVRYKFNNQNGTKSFTHILKKDILSKNKWMNENYSYCKIHFITSIGNFSYVINLEETLKPIFVMSKESLNVSKQLALFIKRLLHKTFDVKIISYEVSEYNLRS